MKTITLFLLIICMFLSSEGQSQIDSQLDSILQSKMNSITTILNARGFGAALRTPDGTIWTGGAGVSSITPVDSISSEHMFPMGSISKTLIAACLLQLQDDGLLNLEDSIAQYLPDYTNVNGDITIRQLLQHVSGVYNYTEHPNFFPSILSNTTQHWTVEEVVNAFVVTPNFSPGDAWHYSNTGFILLGEIVASVTGKPYYTEIRNRIIEPLDLTSFFHPTYDSWQEPVAHLWGNDFTGGPIQDQHSIMPTFNALWTTAGAAGAWVGTPSDIAEWIYQLYTSNIISTGSLNAMIEWTNLSGNAYGLGAENKTFQGKTAWGHTGGIGYISFAFYFPEEDVSLVVQTNEENAGGKVDALFKTLLDAYCNYEPVTLTDNFKKQTEYQIFPNPASDYISIKNLDLSSIQLLNVFNELGSPVTGIQISDNLIDVSALYKGMYIAHILTQDQVIVQQFVVY